MKNRRINIIFACLTVFWFCAVGVVSGAEAATKIGTISLQKVMTQSKSGQEVRQTLEAEIAKYQNELKADQEALKEMDDAIKMKSSIWSEEVRGEKEREFQKKLREFRLKEADANDDLQKLEKDLTDPVIKDLTEVIKAVAKKNGFTMIMEYSEKGTQVRPPLLYAEDSLDISDLVIKELDARRSK